MLGVLDCWASSDCRPDVAPKQYENEWHLNVTIASAQRICSNSRYIGQAEDRAFSKVFGVTAGFPSSSCLALQSGTAAKSQRLPRDAWIPDAVTADISFAFLKACSSGVSFVCFFFFLSSDEPAEQKESNEHGFVLPWISDRINVLQCYSIICTITEVGVALVVLVHRLRLLLLKKVAL